MCYNTPSVCTILHYVQLITPNNEKRIRFREKKIVLQLYSDYTTIRITCVGYDDDNNNNACVLVAVQQNGRTLIEEETVTTTSCCEPLDCSEEHEKAERTYGRW